MTGREKCDRLKAIRKALAEKLGIELHQKECDYEGDCTGTCPACKKEENILNAALLKKGAAAAGAVIVMAGMAGCTPGTEELSGEVAPEPEQVIEEPIQDESLQQDIDSERTMAGRVAIRDFDDPEGERQQ